MGPCDPAEAQTLSMIVPVNVRVSGAFCAEGRTAKAMLSTQAIRSGAALFMWGSLARLARCGRAAPAYRIRHLRLRKEPAADRRGEAGPPQSRRARASR